MPEIEKTERPIAPIGSSKSVAEAPAPEGREEEPRESAGPMDDAEYERLLDMYDVSFKNFAEGEVVKGIVLQVSESEVIVDVGYKSEGIIPVDEFRDETGKLSIKVGDIGRRAPGEDGGQGRLRRPLQGEGREDEGLGRRGARLSGAPRRRGPRHRARQGRPRRRHRRARVPPRLAGRPPPRAQPGQPQGPGAAHARHQGQQEARQHRALAQGRPRRRERRAEARHPGDPRRGQGPHGHGEEHHRVRRLHRPRRHRRPAPHHRHVLGPHQPPERGAQRRRRDQGQGPEVRPRERARLASATSSSRPIPGRPPPSSTRWARASRARSSASPTTARSSSSSRASRA